MWIDSSLEFSDAQAIIADAASTDHVNLGSDRNVGPGAPLYVVVQVDVAVAGTSPTYDITLQTDDNSAFSSATTIASFTQITDVNGVAGARFWIAVPSENEQFLRLFYTDGGTGPTGTFSAWLTNEQPESTLGNMYPDATN
jgi:hypothetical protein